MTASVWAALPIVDAISVALVEAALGAEAPNGKLNKPREDGWELAIERLGVDLLGDNGENSRAAVGGVTTRPVDMRT